MTAQNKISSLIKRFEENREAYLSGRYNETQLRREFIDPFFRELGWDVDNEGGLPETYKDVIHEDAIKIGGFSKAPDYCFRVGGTRKFFIEAKNPSVNLKEDVNPAFQLRRYAWSAKLPLSILTDFEEFAVYDTRIKPLKTDKPATARILYFTYKDYLSRWDEIAAVFSQEAVSKGSFDKYAQSVKTKKGTEEVDRAFLDEIESWRAMLAKNISIRNPSLSARELNFVIQRTIDRIIFLRICEDRGIETYGTLQALLNGPNVYARLFEIFERADDRYNSGIFHFRKEKGRPETPDELSPKIKIDDAVLKSIFKSLYFPESSYEFSVLPIEILGQVYEQFLGQVIHLTAGGHAKIEEKPEVKKAGGVYYTPSYIVDYIVKNTVGKLVEGKTPRQVAKLKVLDPACGSGSFLIGAYQYLLTWHRDWYVNDGIAKWTKGKNSVLYQHRKDDWRLTTFEKKKILLNNIYGVDIDAQAVEVTKLSLLLKVLEGESGEVISKQYRLFHERVLPDLGNNIKCGNSLIGSDIYSNGQIELWTDEERLRVNPFDWDKEFPDVFSAGGFDAVVGNPPYIFVREQLTNHDREYFSSHYKLSWEKQNTFMLFMELMLRLLNKKASGGFIVPNSWLTIESAKMLRPALIPRLELVSDLNYQVFSKVSMEPCIFILSGSDQPSNVLAFRANSKDEFLSSKPIVLDRNRWVLSRHRIVFSKSSNVNIFDKLMKNFVLIGDVFDVRTGLQAYEKGKGTPPQSALDVKNHIFDRNCKEDKNSYRYLEGKNIGRYSFNWSGMWMQYGPWLSQPREIEIFSRPRVLLREITSQFPKCLNSTLITEVFLNNKSILNVLHAQDKECELKMLVGILNSRLISYYYKSHAVKSERKIFPKVVIRNLREFPYPKKISEEDKKRVVSAVERMIMHHREMITGKTGHERTALQRQIDVTDAEIDRLVYQLYGLTEEEIKIVESSAK